MTLRRKFRLPFRCFFYRLPADNGCLQWEKVGDALAESSVRVGAVNCVKHSTFCRERGIHLYPSLVALNYPGAGPGTAAKPALKTMKPGHKSFDEVLNEIKGVFSCLDECIDCMLRLEDAIMSVRFTLKHDVFTEGLQLSDDRKGESRHAPYRCTTQTGL